MSINEVSLFGTLVGDVTLRHNANNKPVTRFTVRTYKTKPGSDDGRSRTETCDHTVVCRDTSCNEKLMQDGVAGAWVKVRGEIVYRDGKTVVQVYKHEGSALVVPYFGTDVTPDTPHLTANAETADTTMLDADGTDDSAVMPATAEATGEAPVEDDFPGDRIREEARSRTADADRPDDRSGHDDTASGLDALHAEADAAAADSDADHAGDRDDPNADENETQESQASEPAATVQPAPAAIPGIRRPTAPPPVPAAPLRALPPARPVAPPVATAPATPPRPAFPTRPPSGMPRPVAPATPASTAPRPGGFARPALPQSAPRPTSPASQAAKPTQAPQSGFKQLGPDDIPF